MIRVEVRVYATLARHLPGYRPGDTMAVELPGGATLSDLLKEIGIPRDMPKLLVVNGRAEEAGYVLASGDRVALFSPVVGG